MQYFSAGGGAGFEAETVPIAQLSDVADLTGSGETVVLSESPTIVTPTIASLVNMNHTHGDGPGGGALAPKAVLEVAHAALPNGRVLGTDPVVLPDELTTLPVGARAWQTLKSMRINFDDVPGNHLRLTALARHFHRGTAQFTDGKVRVKIDGSTVYTSGTLGSGSNNATGADLDSGLQSYTKPAGLKTVLIEGEAALSGANTSQVVLADWLLTLKYST